MVFVSADRAPIAMNENTDDEGHFTTSQCADNESDLEDFLPTDPVTFIIIIYCEVKKVFLIQILCKCNFVTLVWSLIHSFTFWGTDYMYK